MICPQCGSSNIDGSITCSICGTQLGDTVQTYQQPPVHSSQNQPGQIEECSQCEKTFPAREMVEYSGSHICKGCKPSFFQKIREGVETQDREYAFKDYAGFWRRAAAFVIDALILEFMLIIIDYIFAYFIGDLMETMGYESQDIQSMIIFLDGLRVLIGGWLYYTIMEASSKQATLGKMALGIIVVDYEVKRISWARANVRYFAEIMSILALGIGYVMAAFNEEKQTFHDKVAQTFVVLK
jgi:uncharacterized RDD family membrane protein YckC